MAVMDQDMRGRVVTKQQRNIDPFAQTVLETTTAMDQFMRVRIADLAKKETRRDEQSNLRCPPIGWLAKASTTSASTPKCAKPNNVDSRAAAGNSASDVGGVIWCTISSRVAVSTLRNTTAATIHQPPYIAASHSKATGVNVATVNRRIGVIICHICVM